MAEYIEREKTIRDLEKLCVDEKMIGNDNSTYIDFADAIEVVAEQPTADVQEVRHGKWLYEDSDIGWTDYKCSYCGNIISTVAQDEDLYSYCPYCGAKMELRNSEND